MSRGHGTTARGGARAGGADQTQGQRLTTPGWLARGEGRSPARTGFSLAGRSRRMIVSWARGSPLAIDGHLRSRGRPPEGAESRRNRAREGRFRGASHRHRNARTRRTNESTHGLDPLTNRSAPRAKRRTPARRRRRSLPFAIRIRSFSCGAAQRPASPRSFTASRPVARCCLERCRGLGRTRVQVRQPPAAAAPCPEKGQLPMTRSTRFRAAWRHAAPARNAGESLLMASRRRGAPHPPRLRRSDGARRTHAHPRHSMSECAWSCRGSEDPARMQRDSQLSATPDHGTDTVTLATVTSSV